MIGIIEKYRNYVGPTDERLASESNRIYKHGFIGLAASCLAAMIYEAMLNNISFVHDLTHDGIEQHAFPPMALLAIGLFITCTVVGIAHTRRGIVDDNRFADAESFPAGYYGLLTLASTLTLFLGILALRVWAEAQLVGIASVRPMDSFVVALVYALIFAPLFFAAFYATFKSASRRRDRLADELDS